MNKIKSFFWTLKHLIIIEAQLKTNNPVLYQKLTDLRKSLGAL